MSAVPDEGFSGLAGPRVLLRRFEPADARALAAYRSDPQVARYQGWDAPYPLAEAERLIGQLARRQPDTPGQWFQFAVALRPAGPLLGDVGVLTCGDDPRQCEIGFTLAAAHQHRGYATEAVRLVAGYLFTARGKHRITASCDARNTASAALLERLGMRREGHLRASTWAKGEWTDDLLYGLLRVEWAERENPAHKEPGGIRRTV